MIIFFIRIIFYFIDINFVNDNIHSIKIEKY